MLAPKGKAAPATDRMDLERSNTIPASRKSKKLNMFGNATGQAEYPGDQGAAGQSATAKSAGDPLPAPSQPSRRPRKARSAQAVTATTANNDSCQSTADLLKRLDSRNIRGICSGRARGMRSLICSQRSQENGPP